MTHEQFKFLKEGELANREDAKDAAVLVLVNDEEEKNTVHIFSSDEHFDEWTRKSRYSKEIIERKKQIEQRREEMKDKHENQLARESKEKSDELKLQIMNLSQELNIPISSVDLIREAEKRGIGNTMIVYDFTCEHA
jgi:hypothetical protein